MKNKVISASAGTGKTYRLALEFLATLLQDRSLKPEEILVMTFTVKATSEIKQRILAFLKSCPHDKNLQKNLESICNTKLTKEDFSYLSSFAKYLLFDKDKLKVCTLDSYLQSVFNNLISEEISDAPFSVSTSLSAKKREEILEKIFALEESHKFFIDRQDKTLDKFSSFVDKLLSINLREHKCKPIKYEKEVDILRHNLAELQFVTNSVSPKNSLPANKIFLKPFREFLEKKIGSPSDNFAEDFAKITKDESFYLEAYENLGNDIWRKSPFLKKIKCDNPEALENLKEVYSEFQSTFKNFLFKTKAYAEHNQLLDLATKAQDYYNEETNQKLTFTDFGRLLQASFSEKTFLTNAGTLKGEFWQFLDVLPKILMIDEFQDTSVDQYQNLLPIINVTKEKGGSVVVVGDSKQAIYSWRGGEQALLGKIPNILPNCESLVLDTNYRSSVNVVSLVNNLFGRDYGKLWDYQEVNSSLKNRGFVSYETRKSKAKKDKLEDLINSFVTESIVPSLNNNKIDLSKCAIIARKNKELSYFAEALKKNGIDTYQKQADSLLEHVAIKPFMLYLKFYAYNDLHSLYQFLKGAPLHFNGTKIKNILKNKDLLEEYSLENSANFFADFIKKFNYLDYFADTNDQKNILSLAKILSGINNGVTEILEYLDENRDELKKVEDVNKNAVNLLTIHSCKGLEFDTVFYFMNCSNGGNNQNALQNFVFYNSDFTEIEDSMLTYSYKKLAEDNYNLKQKNDLEILNLVYVSLTRAVNNLFIFSNFDVAKTDYNELNISEKLSYELMSCFSESETNEKSEEIFSAQKGEYQIPRHAIEKTNSSYAWNNLSLNLSANYVTKIKQKRNEENLLFGEMVHYYLSFLKWNTDKEKELAKKMTLAKYGAKWENQLRFLNKIVSENSWLYDKQKWGNVLCEMPLVDNGKEYRVDRIMVSHDNKSAFIVDYKTGDIVDESQLETYSNIIKKLYNFAKVDVAYLEIK